MTTGRRRRSTIEMGHDAFLDIVANLVGIMIILVVVLGTQSQPQPEIEPDQPEPVELATDSQLSELAHEQFRAASAQRDSIRFERMIKQNESDLQRTKQMRDRLLDLVSIAEQTWEDQKSELDAEAVAAAQRNTKADQLRQQLEDVRGQQEAASAEKPPVHAIAHLPTPMAKTVFGKEVHFRLEANRLSVVPIDRLLEEIKTDLRRNLKGSREGQLTSAVGPVRGFIANYAMTKDQALVNRGGQIGMTTRGQLVGLTIEPLVGVEGQPIEKVFEGSSELDIELAGRNPNSTTITVWVYPDSYASFRRLKEHLYAKGFATAARPMEAGRPITGGPQGTRSVAQ